MNEIKEYNDLSINKYGTIGSLMNGYLDSYLNRDEIEVINKNIDILNKKLEDFNIFKYKIINRYKIRNLIVKVLSEEKDDFIEIAVDLLNLSEDNFENIIDGFMKLTKNDIDVLYYNLWKKHGVDYAIEIKGNLTDKDEIERALKQIEFDGKYAISSSYLQWKHL